MDLSPSTPLVAQLPGSTGSLSEEIRQDDKLSYKHPAASPAKDPVSKKKYYAATWDTENTMATQDTLSAFPASDHPASEQALKEMLTSLKKDLQAELCKTVSDLQVHVEHLEDRMDSVEHKLGDCIAAHNDLVGGYQERNADIQWLKNKVTKLRDRFRRNNLKFRGIPESISPPELTPYLL